MVRFALNRACSTVTCGTVLFLLIPDQVQPRIFNEEFAPSLKPDVAIVVASGYNVYYKLLNFKPTQDVVMVAPRCAYLLSSDELN